MNDSILVTVIGMLVACFGSNGFWQWLMTKRKKRTPSDDMLLAIGRDRLCHLAKKYLTIGEIPEDEYESFIAMGEAYQKLGGNSYVKKLYEECKELHIERKK